MFHSLIYSLDRLQLAAVLCLPFFMKLAKSCRISINNVRYAFKNYKTVEITMMYTRWTELACLLC